MDKQQLFRCKICGDVYFGAHPSHCPYCGAHRKYIVPIAEWKEENLNQKIGDKDRENLKTGRDLEFFNTRFYRAAVQSDNPEISGYFKYLVRMENEHYTVLSKLLGQEKDPEINNPAESKGSDLGNLEFSSKREAIASEKYRQFAEEAVNPRVKVVFTALSEIENDHLNLDHLEINNIKERGNNE